jgi:hypothetical protein
MGAAALGLVQDHLDHRRHRTFDGRAAQLAIALAGMGIAQRQEAAGHRHGQEHAGPRPQPPVVDIAAEIGGGTESTRSEWAGASATTPKWGRTESRCRAGR